MSAETEEEREISIACGRPAILLDSNVVLTSEVKNLIKSDSVIKVYRAGKNQYSDVIIANRSDLEVSLACEQLLQEHERSYNAAVLLGQKFKCISVTCKPVGSRAQSHPPCSHASSSRPLTVQGSRRIRYRCKLCLQMEDNIEKLLEHQRVKHHNLPPTKVDDNAYKLIKGNCNTCSSSHVIGKYSCANCDFSSTCPFALEKHMKSVHKSQQIYHCPSCDHQHHYYTAMERHLFEKHCETTDDKEIPEPVVNIPVSTERKNKTKEDNAQLRTKAADSASSSETQLILYEAKMTKLVEGEPHLCAYCGGRFRSARTLDVHLTAMHVVTRRYFKCCLCELVFNKLSLLHDHYRLPLHKKLLPVFEMSINYDSDNKQYQDVRRHVSLIVSMAHTPFVCSLDHLTFRRDVTFEKVSSKIYRRDRLTERLQELSSQKETVYLVCKICGFGPAMKPDMINHLIKHTQFWPFSCPGCEECFKQKAKAVKHAKSCSINADKALSRVLIKMTDLRRQNEQIIAFLLSHCEFTRPPLMDEYKLSQFYTIREFWCDICKHDSVSYSDITEHMVEHVEGCEPYTCTHCKMAFKSRRLTQAHILRDDCPGSIKYDSILVLSAREGGRLKAKESVTMVEFSISSLPLTKHGFRGSVAPSLQHYLDSQNPPINQFDCTPCRRRFMNSTEMVTHVVNHLQFTPWTCQKCSKSFRTYYGPQGFLEHAQFHHPSEKMTDCELFDRDAFKKQEKAAMKIFIGKDRPNILDNARKPTLTVSDPVEQPVLKKRVDKRKQSLHGYTYEDRSEARSEFVELEPVEDSSEESNEEELPPPPKTVRTSPRSYAKKHTFAKVTTPKVTTPKVTTAKVTIPKVTIPKVTTSKVATPKVVTPKVATTKPIIPSTKPTDSFICPQCEDFEGVWSDLLIHYEAMHSDMAVCTKCEESPCLHIVDFYKHMTQNHRGFKVSDCSTRRTDSKILARDLIEQMGTIARKKTRTRLTDTVVTCSLMCVTLSAVGGLEAARFICRLCRYTSRSSDSFLAHIIEHMCIGEYHCLYCPYEANEHKMRLHYRDNHPSKMHIFPYSLTYKRFTNLMERILNKLEKENENVDEIVAANSQTDRVPGGVEIKREPGDELTAKQTDSEAIGRVGKQWTFAFFCAFCDLKLKSLAECKQHLETSHPRKPIEVAVDITVWINEESARAIADGELCKKSKKIFTFDQPTESAETSSVVYPKGYELMRIDSQKFSQLYYDAMFGLYNHFSIFEVVGVLGSDFSCHMCQIGQETFPALFEHWIREHTVVEPYCCAFCQILAKRTATILSHEKRAHPKEYGSKYVINMTLFEEAFDTLERYLKKWLKIHRVDSFIPDDLKLVVNPVVVLEDVKKDPKYSSYFAQSVNANVGAVKSRVSSRRRRKP